MGLIEQAGFESMEDSTMLFYEVSSVKNSLLAQRLEELSPMLKAVKSIIGEPEESEPMFYYLYNSGSNRV